MSSITSSKPFNQSFAPWGTGEPNGDTMENCGILSVWWGGWNDIDCSEKYCAACQIPVTPVFVLRGYILPNHLLVEPRYYHSNGSKIILLPWPW